MRSVLGFRALGGFVRMVLGMFGFWVATETSVQ